MGGGPQAVAVSGAVVGVGASGWNGGCRGHLEKRGIQT